MAPSSDSVISVPTTDFDTPLILALQSVNGKLQMMHSLLALQVLPDLYVQPHMSCVGDMGAMQGFNSTPCLSSPLPA